MQEFILTAHVLEKEIAKLTDAEPDAEILLARLKGLGYID